MCNLGKGGGAGRIWCHTDHQAFVLQAPFDICPPRNPCLRHALASFAVPVSRVSYQKQNPNKWLPSTFEFSGSDGSRVVGVGDLARYRWLDSGSLMVFVTQSRHRHVVAVPRWAAEAAPSHADGDRPTSSWHPQDIHGCWHTVTPCWVAVGAKTLAAGSSIRGC